MSALTNSTYDGVCYNVLKIKERLAKQVANLHFDEAWYAYAKFHPIYANHFGMADHVQGEALAPVFCSQSTHKLLTAFSQASMIHIKNGDAYKINPDLFNESYMMHGSTSPQYNMVASLEVATKMMHDNGAVIINDIIHEAIQLRKKVVSIGKDLAARDANDWFFGMWQPEQVEYKQKMTDFEDVPTEALAGDQKAWVMTRENNWHGFDLTADEEDYVMLDPIKLTFTCPGIDDKGNISEVGIPAAVVTNYLISKGVVPEKSDYYSWLLLNSLGTTRGKQGTVLAELFKFKELYDANAALEDLFPDMVKKYPVYMNNGLQDHCRAMHSYFSRTSILEKMQAAFDVIPEQKMTPAEAYHCIVKQQVAYVDIDQMQDRTAAVMIVPYPPGIPIMMGGEVMNAKALPIHQYLLLRQDFENAFPGYESDIHGITRVKRNGRLYFRTFCIAE
jgi:lysine decarboxylase/arginine decarboxylase